MCKRLLRWITSAIAVGVLSACASDARPPAGQAPAATSICCSSLADLAFTPLGAGGSARVELGADAPRFSFDSGTSPVAGFRLPDTPRPLMLDLVSHQMSGPGVVEQMFLPFLKRKATAFNPTVWILDAQHRVRRSVSATGVTAYCNLTDVSGGGPVIDMHVPISESANDAAFIVLATSDAQRARSIDSLCKDVDLAYGDLARVDLTLHAPPFGDGQIVLDTAAGWYPNQRKLGVLSAIATGFKNPLTGRLVIGQERLSFYRYEAGPLRREFDAPLDRVVMANADLSAPPTLALALATDSSRSLQWHTFIFPERLRSPDARPAAVEQALRERIRPDMLVERVGFTVAPWSLDLGFQVAAGGIDRDSAASRIGQAAVTGGIVTALPCGLCQIGGCTPDMLVACAAAFSVGAVIGGVWTAGHELLAGERKPPEPAKPGASPAEVRQAAVAPLAATSRRFDHVALQQCVFDTLAERDGAAWREQGVTARFESLASPSPSAGSDAPADANRPGAALKHLVSVQMNALTLVAAVRRADDAPTADAEATLNLVGSMQVSDLPGGAARIWPLSWRSDVRTLARWAELPASDIAAELDRACKRIAETVATHAQAHWRTRH